MNAEYNFAAVIGGNTIALPYGGIYSRGGIGISLEKETVDDSCDLLTPKLSCEGEKSESIKDIRSLSFAAKCSGKAVLRTLKGDNCSKESFLPLSFDLTDGDILTFAPTGGRSSNTTAFPFFDIDFGVTDRMFAVGWSGQWKAVIERHGDEITVEIGLETADFYMTQGEEFTLPTVMTVESGSRHETLKKFRSVMRTRFNPLPAGMDHLPISIQPFDRYFRQNAEWETEKGQIRTLGKACECGSFDTLWIDAAWFRDGFPTGVGNYSFESGFPNGLRPISDAVHARGMRFMVWFEPERVFKGSEVWKDHFDFLLSVGDEYTFLYNLGDEKAWQWLYETLSGFIRDNGIDNYRQDFNMEPQIFWQKNDLPGRTGVCEIKYINGLYRLWDALKKDFPNLMIDDCASGGRRIDFETMRRSVPMWRSDITCHPITETAHNDVWNQNETLGLAEYLPYHACACWEPKANDIRSAATSGLACTFDVLNPEFDFEAAKNVLSETERHAHFWTCDFIPLTVATLDESVWCGWQFAGPSSGFAEFFRRAEAKEEEFTFRPSGISAGRSYKITITDENYHSETRIMSGADFAAGITIRCPEPHTSAVVEYETAD